MAEEVKAPAKCKFKDLECPYDLEDIFPFQVNTDNLRGLLQFILENLGKCDHKIGDVEIQVKTKLMQVDK